jgi:putative oxidoreductase
MNQEAFSTLKCKTTLIKQMKFLFSVKPKYTATNMSLLLLRLGIGGLMLTHGLPKLQRLFGDGEISFADPLGIGMLPSLLAAIIAEVVGSIMIILGLGTRLASISLIFTMAVAVFMVHADDPFARKELGLIYLLAYSVLLIMGSGKFSVDRFISR